MNKPIDEGLLGYYIFFNIPSGMSDSERSLVMLFKVSHIKADGTMAKVQSIEAGSLYAAYLVYLEQHKGIEVGALVNAGDAKAVKSASKTVKEGKTMTKNSTAKKSAKTAKSETKKSAKGDKTMAKKTNKTAKAEAPKTEGVKAVFTLNDEHKGIEIKFNEKPSAEVRAQLKALKFRWHQTKGLWYAKQNEQTLALAKSLCEAEKPAKKPAKKAQPKAEVKVEEPKAPAKKPSRKGIESFKAKDGERISERLIKALNRTEGITAEVIVKNEGEDGWLWVTGEGTKEHKDKLKELGFFWSGKKQAWYLSPAPLKRNYKTQFSSMDALRSAALA